MSSGFRWIVVEADRALYVDRGQTVVLCDRLPSPVTLLLRVRDVDAGAVAAPASSLRSNSR